MKYQNNVSDEQLIQQIKEFSCEKSWSALYGRYNFKLLNCISGLNPNDTTWIQDVASETWLIVLNSIKTNYHEERPFASWLLKIGLRTALEQLATNKRLQMVEIESDNIPEITITKVFQNEEAGLLELMISKLPKKQAEAVRLKYHHNLNLTEISEAIDIAVSTAHNRLEAGYANLRKLFLKNPQLIANFL